MAYSYLEQEYSIQTSFLLPFTYINKTDISLYINSVPMPYENIIWISDYVVFTDLTLESGDIVRFQRDSSIDSIIVDYITGNTISEQNLDVSNTQHLFLAQETRDYFEEYANDLLNHDHNTLYYTKSEVDVKLSTVGGEGHTHDNLYYREYEVNAILNTYYYTQAEANILLDTKSDTTHNHDYNTLTNLPSIYDGSGSIAAGALVALDDGSVLPTMNAGALTNLTPANITGVDPVSGSETNFLNEKGGFTSVEGEANVNADWDSVSGDSEILNKPDTYDGSDTLTAGDLIAANTSNEFPILDGKNITNLGIDNLDGINPATGDTNKLLSEKGSFTDLSAITGGEVNVQADWTQTTDTHDAYIENKPTIPSTLTLLDEATTDGTFLNNAGGYTIPDVTDTHYTKTQADSLLLNKSDTTHNHDDIYYTETETDALLGNKSATPHTHTQAGITDVTATFTEINTVCDGDTAKNNHTHALSDFSITSTASNINLVSASTSAKNVHTHDDRYYTETEVDGLLAGVSWAHPTISGATAETIDNAACTVLQDITTEGNGHVTNIASHTLTLSDFSITATDTEINTVADGATAKNSHTHDTRYYTEAESDALYVKTLANLAITATADEINTICDGTVLQWTDAGSYINPIASTNFQIADTGALTLFGSTASSTNNVIFDTNQDAPSINIKKKTATRNASFSQEIAIFEHYKILGGVKEGVCGSSVSIDYLPTLTGVGSGYDCSNDVGLSVRVKYPEAENYPGMTGGKINQGSAFAGWFYVNGCNVSTQYRGLVGVEINVQENEADKGYIESVKTEKTSVCVQLVPESMNQNAHNINFGCTTLYKDRSTEGYGVKRTYVGYATGENSIALGGTGFLAAGFKAGTQLNGSSFSVTPNIALKVTGGWNIGLDMTNLDLPGDYRAIQLKADHRIYFGDSVLWVVGEDLYFKPVSGAARKVQLV